MTAFPKRETLRELGALWTSSGSSRIFVNSADRYAVGAEPYLCKEILEGRISGSIENYMSVMVSYV